MLLRYSLVKCLYRCKAIILETFFAHSHREVANNYCTTSYVIMTPSVEPCCIISCQCSLMEGEKLLTRACDMWFRCWELGWDLSATLSSICRERPPVAWPHGGCCWLRLTFRVAGHWEPVKFRWLSAWVEEQISRLSSERNVFTGAYTQYWPWWKLCFVFKSKNRKTLWASRSLLIAFI